METTMTNPNEASLTYHRAEQQLDAALQAINTHPEPEQYQALLTAFDQLLQVRDTSFPMLLGNGQPLNLHFPPVSLYLLPPYRNTETRYLVAFFYLQDGKAGVQVIAWQFEDIEGTPQSCLSVLPHKEEKTQSTVSPPVNIEECTHRLDRPPLRIEIAQLGNSHFAQFEFTEGLLEIGFDERNGINQRLWTPATTRVESRQWIQRSSWGEMPVLVRLQRQHSRKNWQDDQVEFVQTPQQSVFPQPTLGRIRGVDGLPNGQAVYLASNLGKVFSATQNQTSQAFSNEIWDLLVLPVDAAQPQASDGKHYVLIVEKEGFFYLLDSELKVKHWQNCGQQIVRLLGNGSHNLISVDKDGQLTPLHFRQPERFREQRQQASQMLTEYYFKKQTRWGLPALSNNNLLHQQGGLLLYYFFCHLSPPDLVFCADLENWIDQLQQQWQVTPQDDGLVKLYQRLLKHVLRGVINSCYSKRYSTDWNQQFPLQANATLNPALSIVLKILTLPETAPDDIWLHLLRHRDWLDLWARHTVLIEQAPFKQRLGDLQKRIDQTGKQFLPAFAKLRPLNFVTTYRVQHSVLHMDWLGGDQYVAALTADGWLQVLEVAKAQGEDWLVTRLDKRPWRGLPSFVRTVNSGSQTWIVVGTLRGELFRLSWSAENRQINVEQMWEVDFAIHCSRFVESSSMLLLGGRSQAGHACLYRWDLSKPTVKPSMIWSDSQSNSASVMMRHNQKYVWIIDRDRGLLLVWELATLMRAQRVLVVPKRWLSSVYKLFCLEYVPESEQLICGGEGGRIWCLDARDGTICWTIQAPSDLRHVRYLFRNDGSKQPLWLLVCDRGHNLLVNQDGDIQSIYPFLETVTTLISSVSSPSHQSQNQKFLIATQDGRIAVLAELPGQQITSARVMELQNHPNLLHYSLRLGSAMPQQFLYSVAQAQAQAKDKDLLIRTRLLYLIQNHLKHSPIDGELKQAVEKLVFAEQQYAPDQQGSDLTLQILFLHWLYELETQNADLPEQNQAAILDWVDCYWEQLTRPPNADLWFFMLLAPMLKILKRLQNVAPHQNRATQLRTALNSEICQSLYPPQEFTVHRALRLFLAVRCWRELDSQNTPSERLNAWCNALVQELELQSVEQLTALVKEVVDASLRLLPDQEPQWFWLQSLLNGDPLQLNTVVLSRLSPAKAQPLTTEDLNALQALFANNRAWTTWLDNLQDMLNGLALAQKTALHAANREQMQWLRLREHMARWPELFTLHSGLALLALYGPKLCLHWEQLIQQGMAALEHKVFSQPQDYLDISLRDQWQSKTRVELQLQIVNRFRSRLELQQIFWQQQPLTLESLPLVVDTPKDKDKDKSVELRFTLTTQDETLAGDLRLICYELESNRRVEIGKAVAIKRSIAMLSREPIWQPTWARLLLLLDQFQGQQQLFCWVDGAVWAVEQRQQLLGDVATQFQYFQHEPQAPDQLKVDFEQGPWFSPDLALGAAASVQLSQLHDVLAGFPDTKPWRLAVWHWALPLPQALVAHLDLPQPQQVQCVIKGLLAEDDNAVQSLKQVLCQMPARAVGAWCANEPFMLAQSNELTASELYLPALMQLDSQLWQALQQVDDPGLVADWLGMPHTAFTQHLQQHVSACRYYAELATPQQHYGFDVDQLAYRLLEQLGSGRIRFNAKPAYWRIQLESPLTLNWQDYSDCRLLPYQATSRLQVNDADQHSLWLCVGYKQLPDLPGTKLALEQADCLALLHAENQCDIERWLNRSLARQQQRLIGVFRTNGGLGALVTKHFYGRKEQLAQLNACLAMADAQQIGVEGRGGALLIGGRRMGKTSLREKMQFDLRRNDPQRLLWTFNFESMPEYLHGNELERWFYVRCAEQSAKANEGSVFVLDWPEAQKDSASWRDHNRKKLRDYLQRCKQKTAKTPLWLFDETDWLARADTVLERARWLLFSFFRQLINMGDLCIFATTYPHSAEQPFALNVAHYNAHSPLHNTFTHLVELKPWTPSEAWDFLHSRLSGMGVILPRYYRDEFLGLTRGVVWLVHALGDALCAALPQTTGLKVVDANVWQQAKRVCLKEMEKALKIPVDQTARWQDQKQGVSMSQTPEASLEHLLWPTLLSLVQPIELPVAQGDQWLQAPQQLSLQQFLEAMPRVKPSALVAALGELTASPTLVGDILDRNVYRFACNLLPTWCYLNNLQGRGQ